MLELYASTEGNAILANLSGEKVGSVGRPIPGSALAVAALDAARRELRNDASGFCVPAGPNETGLLLARVDRERGALPGRPLRSALEKGDAWYATRHLFRCDEDGDYWLVDQVDDLIRHRSGPLPSRPIEEAIWELNWVSAAAAYGIDPNGSGFEIPVAAVVPRRGADLDRQALAACVESRLARHSRPQIVRFVDEIPMTDGYRFRKAPLRAAGIGDADLRGRALWYDASEHAYRDLDARTLQRLRRASEPPSPPGAG